MRIYTNEKGLLIIYCKNTSEVNIIEITETGYEIIQKLYNILYPSFPSIIIRESYENKLIIVQNDFYIDSPNNLSFYNFINNKYELCTKLKIEHMENFNIYPLKGKILIENQENNILIFINSITGKITSLIINDNLKYCTINGIYEYKKNYILINSGDVFIFDHKNYCFIKICTKF